MREFNLTLPIFSLVIKVQDINRRSFKTAVPSTHLLAKDNIKMRIFNLTLPNFSLVNKCEGSFRIAVFSTHLSAKDNIKMRKFNWALPNFSHVKKGECHKNRSPKTLAKTNNPNNCNQHNNRAKKVPTFTLQSQTTLLKSKKILLFPNSPKAYLK